MGTPLRHDIAGDDRAGPPAAQMTGVEHDEVPALVNPVLRARTALRSIVNHLDQHWTAGSH